MITTTPRQQLQAILEDSLYLPHCKCCNFPLSPHQMTTGLCALCERKLAGLGPRRGDWDFEAACMPEGFRG